VPRNAASTGPPGPRPRRGRCRRHRSTVIEDGATDATASARRIRRRSCGSGAAENPRRRCSARAARTRFRAQARRQRAAAPSTRAECRTRAAPTTSPFSSHRALLPHVSGSGRVRCLRPNAHGRKPSLKSRIAPDFFELALGPTGPVSRRPRRSGNRRGAPARRERAHAVPGARRCMEIVAGAYPGKCLLAKKFPGKLATVRPEKWAAASAIVKFFGDRIPKSVVEVCRHTDGGGQQLPASRAPVMCAQPRCASRQESGP